MADRAGDAFIIERRERRLLVRIRFRQGARKQRHWCVTGFAMAGRLDATGPQQDVDALAVEGLAGSIAVQGLQPGAVRILMTGGTARRREEGFRRNILAIFGLGIRGAERLISRL
jgi:hypothetical protein